MILTPEQKGNIILFIGAVTFILVFCFFLKLEIKEAEDRNMRATLMDCCIQKSVKK